ncbi:hypothetical protein [Anabaena sp. CCY 9614]|uniref:hypothetical protein n=1 Tax=Anabaena sp. CCY 9614 TaxID=3103869 RepID=UPI0039C61DA8
MNNQNLINLTQRQASALGRQRRGRVPRLVATGAQRRKVFICVLVSRREIFVNLAM